MADKAPIVSSKLNHRKDPKQLSLHVFYPDNDSSDNQSKEEDSESSDNQSKEEDSTTRTYPLFDVKREPTLVSFRDFLIGIDGGHKSESSAKAIWPDVSKYLKYACGEGELSLSRLLDRDFLALYIEKLYQKTKLSASSIVNKIEALENALPFFRIKVAKRERDLVKSTKVIETLAKWKKDYRRKKKAEARAVIERQSQNPPSLEESTDILRSKKVWLFVERIIQEAKASHNIDPTDLNHVSHLLAHAIMVYSLRRPASVQEATLAAYENGSWEMVDEEQAFVVLVSRHKTADTHGSAKLVFDEFLKKKTDDYIEFLRPLLQDHSRKLPNLFILSGGRSISRLADRVKRLAPKLGFNPATATIVRKAAATATAYKPPQTRAKMAKQLGHTLRVEDTHYTFVHSKKEAAKVVFSLHSNSKPTSDPKARRPSLLTRWS